MKGLVKRGRGLEGVSLEEMKEPQGDEYSVKIKIHGAGVCGTDLHIIKDEYPYLPPVILGHEFSGVVEKVGKYVSTFKKGDRVVSLTASETCENCSYCAQGLIMLCPERKSIGSHVDGAFAQYIVVPEKKVLTIPENIPLDAAVLTEPLACVVRALMERGNINAGDCVFISGCGTIGLLALQVAKANGASVIVSGTTKDANRLEIARQLGAKVVVYTQENMNCFEADRKEQYDVVIECAGANASLNTCIALVKKQGLLIQLGLFGKKVSIDIDLMLMKEINYTNGFATTQNAWEVALQLMKNNQVDLEKLITHKFKLTEWKKAIATSFEKDGLKTIMYAN